MLSGRLPDCCVLRSRSPSFHVSKDTAKGCQTFISHQALMVALNSGAIHGCVGGYAIDLVFVHHLPVSFEVSFQSPLFLTNLSFGTGYFFSGP